MELAGQYTLPLRIRRYLFDDLDRLPVRWGLAHFTVFYTGD